MNFQKLFYIYGLEALNFVGGHLNLWLTNIHSLDGLNPFVKIRKDKLFVPSQMKNVDIQELFYNGRLKIIFDFLDNI